MRSELSFGARLKKMRREKGITQHELGEKINVTAQAISQYEQDKRRPGFEVVNAMAETLGCDIRYLLGFDSPIGTETYLAEEMAALPAEALTELGSYIEYLKQKYKH